MFTHLGISSQLHPENVGETIVKATRMVYIKDYLWASEETRAATIKVADIARKNGISVAFTLSDADVAHTFKMDLLDLLPWSANGKP